MAKESSSDGDLKATVRVYSQLDLLLDLDGNLKICVVQGEAKSESKPKSTQVSFK